MVVYMCILSPYAIIINIYPYTSTYDYKMYIHVLDQQKEEAITISKPVPGPPPGQQQ